jgi:hypothetical protein
MGEMKNVYNILVGNTEETIPLGRSSRRWEDNITMDIKVDHNTYNSSIKPMESRSRPMLFLGFSNHEARKPPVPLSS